MEFLKNKRLFDFIYDGKPLDEQSFTTDAKINNNNTITTAYLFSDGLKVTTIAKYYEEYGAYEWVNYFENTSDKPTKIISNLCDCSCMLPFEYEADKKNEAYFPDPKAATKIYAPSGSTWSADEFYCNIDELHENTRMNHIYPGQTKTYATKGGRSSDTHAPFFNICKNDTGIIFAIGWSGQWNAEISRTNDSITVKTKLEDTYFRLLAGERFRTSSVLIMPYENGYTNAQNRFRRLIKEHFSIIGKSERPTFGPLCANIWGGMKSSSVLERIEAIKSNKLPFDYIWMDAGWYGAETLATPDEFEGDWYTRNGDWSVSPHVHPAQLKDISSAVHEAGMKFLLWIEFERAIYTTPITQEHPEYFLNHPGECSWDFESKLLNLGNPAALEYAYSLLSGLIEDLSLDCLRVDFNFHPLPYWRKNDAQDRKGISEIKYINGLYELFDRLLERFPQLLIDDCASGGRRIDIEMLKRSMPLWRSDAQCPANYDEYFSQCHTLNFNNWLPYSGTGTGRLYDLYRIRSAYGASLATNYTYSERESFADTPEKLEFIKNMCEEYKKVRPFYSEDFYPLTEYSDKLDVWCAYQFDRSSQNDGMLQVFRRDNSPYETAVFKLGTIDTSKEYTFTDIDDNSVFKISGKQLKENGLQLTVKEQRTAKIYIYTSK